MKTLLTVLVSVLVAVGAMTLLNKNEGGLQSETAFERIMRTGVIRCAYWVAPPMIVKDPNTGKMSGAFVEYIEEMGKALNLKIDWAGEINLGTYLQDLNQGKFDAECSTGWPNALRGKQVEYTKPVGYLPFYVYAKEGDTRFDGNLEALNDAAIRFAGHDGGTNSLAQARFFPNSKLVSIPGDAPATEPLDMIKYGKVDATLLSSFEGENYMKNNTGSVRRVESEPLRVIPINISVAANEFRLVNMLNTATDELMHDGTIEKIYRKYGIGEETLLRVRKPYE